MTTIEKQIHSEITKGTKSQQGKAYFLTQNYFGFPLDNEIVEIEVLYGTVTKELIVVVWSMIDGKRSGALVEVVIGERGKVTQA